MRIESLKRAVFIGFDDDIRRRPSTNRSRSTCRSHTSAHEQKKTAPLTCKKKKKLQRLKTDSTLNEKTKHGLRLEGKQVVVVVVSHAHIARWAAGLVRLCWGPQPFCAQKGVLATQIAQLLQQRLFVALKPRRKNTQQDGFVKKGKHTHPQTAREQINRPKNKQMRLSKPVTPPIASGRACQASRQFG